ncbi:hypothetical protein EJB05_04298, partial [Eragrostis curvula]
LLNPNHFFSPVRLESTKPDLERKKGRKETDLSATQDQSPEAKSGTASASSVLAPFNFSLKTRALDRRPPSPSILRRRHLPAAMEFAVVEGESFSPSCPTLIMPALSIGNVGQLAVDLLISSARTRRVAYLDEPSVLPCAGNDAFGPDAVGDLTLALEAYESASHGLAFVQQRSPVITGMMVSFAKNVANFARNIGKDHIIILSSLDSGKRRIIDASSGMQVYYLSSCNEDGSDPEYEKFGWKKLDGYDPCQRQWNCLASLVEGGKLSEDMIGDTDEMTINDYYASLPFAALFSACKAIGLKVSCVLCYCSEGDNMPESFQLAEAACKVVGHGPEKFHGNGSNGWTIPLSWKSVYGPPPDMSIF